MNGFFEVKVIIRILYFLTLFAMFEVGAVKIECIKSDECSCKTNTQQEISLWPMPSRDGIQFETGMEWLFDIHLCHGLDKNTKALNGGCRNATVCQYSKKNTFEIGQFGNVTFGQYDNETKSITLQYYGIFQDNALRSITINLTCNEAGNVTTPPQYDEVTLSELDNTAFLTTATTKAACLRPVRIPIPTSSHPTYPNSTSPHPTSPNSTSPHPTSPSHDVTSSGGLKTVYIVLIAVAGFVILAIGCFASYKKVMKRKRDLLIKEENNEDYGTVPRVHVQNALSTPISGPV